MLRSTRVRDIGLLAVMLCFAALAHPAPPANTYTVSCSKAAGAARASGSCSFTVPASLAAGTYELRLLANNGYTRLATSNSFTVSP